MNFVSETQLEENKKIHGERVEDGTVTVDKPLYEILREQKEKKDADFKEKYLKHRPPKELDEDEVEFLSAVNTRQRELEKEQRDEELRALTEFQTAIMSRTVAVEPAKKVASQPKQSKPSRPLVPSLGISGGIKVQVKRKNETEQSSSKKLQTSKPQSTSSEKSIGTLQLQPKDDKSGPVGPLVAYGDESDADD